MFVVLLFCVVCLLCLFVCLLCVCLFVVLCLDVALSSFLGKCFCQAGFRTFVGDVVLDARFRTRFLLGFLETRLHVYTHVFGQVF